MTQQSDQQGPALSDAPRMAFLGVAEKAVFVRDGHPVTWHHTLVGLRQAVFNYFYPTGLHGWQLALACYDPSKMPKMYVRLVDEAGEQLFRGDLAFLQADDASETGRTALEKREWRLWVPGGPSWFLFTMPLDIVVVLRPGPVRVLLGTAGETPEVAMGVFLCALLDPPALTPDRIAAIRADPRGAKSVRVVMGCKKCPAKLVVTAGLERSEKSDSDPGIWYEDAPVAWTCSCGASTMDLSTIRKNLHGVLGAHLPEGQPESPLSFIRMYEKGSLTDITAEFGALLDTRPPEQDVQSFLERHTVFLHRFSPTRIKPKAPILTKFQVDFAILDSRGVLNLLELEKPGIKLIKKNGDVTQHLQHAFDQVRSWLHLAKRQWAAVLECIGLKEAEVAGIRGAVIAGRDAPYPSDHLLQLKGADHGQIDFFTYDDLLEDALTLVRELS